MDLALLWFFIVGVMFVMYFVLDGFDFGVGISLPFLGKDDVTRRQIINTIGPVWDLNETWVIVAGACLFAAFPEWYATLFSGGYLALLLILLALIARAVSFEWRHQGKGEQWTRWFDWMITIGSAVPAFLWGVVFANVAQGMALAVNPAGGAIYVGGFFGLLSPYALLGGLTTLLLFFTHGLFFIGLKTTGTLHDDARSLGVKVGAATAVSAVAFLAWTVVLVPSALVIACAVLAALLFVVAYLCNLKDRDGWAFALTCGTVAFAVLTLYMALFTREGGPYVLPASNPEGDFVGLTVANASSSQMTLEVMSWAALAIVPFVLAYQAWTYWVFRKRVTREAIEASAH